jgi:hypothetical protein
LRNTLIFIHFFNEPPNQQAAITLKTQNPADRLAEISACRESPAASAG